MKQSSSTHFGGIPLDTNTLAGQWMTFSHMANHYRKLLNVKPRVDTGLPAGGGGSASNFRGSCHNLSKMIQSSKSGKKKKNSSTNSNTNDSLYNHSHHHHKHRGGESSIYSSHPDHLNTCSPGKSNSKPCHDSMELTIKSPLKNGRSKKKALTSHYPEYQVVFGPSSIRSSSDAFLSDESASTVSNDNNKPPPDVQAPIGVTEKIRRFLNHIHQLDLTTTTTSKSSSKKSKRLTTTVTSTAPLTPTGSSVGTADRTGAIASGFVPTAREHRHQTRHSKCFLPYEPPSPKSPRKCTSSSVPVITGSKASPSKHLSSPKAPKIVVEDDHHHHYQQFSKSAHHFHHHRQVQQQQSPKLARNKFTGSGGDIYTMVPEKDTNHASKRPKTRKRAESIGSIGTICGSDELTAEEYPSHVTMKDIYSTLERGLGDDNALLQRIMDANMQSLRHSKKSPRKVLREQDRNKGYREIRNRSDIPSLAKSSSMLSLIPSSSNDGGSVEEAARVGKSNRNHNRHHLKEASSSVTVQAGEPQKKDSSRDSAYGFSSGESRITTRESTPEKRCLSEGLHGGKGTSKLHVDFEDGVKSSKNLHKGGLISIEKRYETRVSKENNHRHSSSSRLKEMDKVSLNRKGKSTSTSDLRRRDSNDNYITFLMDLTQDVVRKGIYTNKGLKTLFKSHVEQNRNLDQNKLADMVERLRMDLGIPKDDSLDKIEFGYGSVSDVSSPAYFYTPSAQPREKISTESVILSAKSVASLVSAGNNIPPTPFSEEGASNPSSHPSSPSPTTMIPSAVIPEVAESAAAITSTTTGFSSSGGPNTSSNRSSTTGLTEDGGSGAGDFISVPDDSEHTYITTHVKRHLDDSDDIEDEEEDDEGNVHLDEDIEDELSLSETEVSQYLKVAGLDDGTMQSVMGLLKS